MLNTCVIHKCMPHRYWAVLLVGILLWIPGAALTRPGNRSVASATEPDESTERQAESSLDPKEGEPPADTGAAAGTDERIKVEKVEQIVDPASGSVVFNFAADAPKGTRFYVSYRHLNVRGAASSVAMFEAKGGQLAELTVTLGYRPEFKGDRSVDVLRSQEELLDYQIEQSGCTGGDMSTIVSAPLRTLPPDDRTLVFFKSKAEPGAVTKYGARRIFFVCPKSQTDKNPNDLTGPYSEMVVELYKPAPKRELTTVQRLDNHWQRQQLEVGSADIQFRLLRSGTDRLAPLSRDEVNKILREANLDEHPESFAAAAVTLFTPEAAAKVFPPEVLAALKSGKPPWRSEYSSIGIKASERIWDNVHIFDGEFDLRYNVANRQIDVYPDSRSSVRMMALSDFRIQRAPGSLSAFNSEGQPQGKVLFLRDAEHSQVELLVDPATGFISHQSYLSNKPRADQYRTDDFQYAPKRYPGGIIFPTLKVQVKYSRGQLQSLEMVKIDEAQFNEGLAGNKFILAAKAGAKVFVRGDDPLKEPTFLAVRIDVDDVVEFIRVSLASAQSHVTRATRYLHEGKHDRAIEEYSEAIRVDPTYAQAYNGLAWLRATCPQVKYRDGKQAVELGTKLCELTQGKEIYALDTLAAAYAEQGKFDEAVRQQTRAIDLTTEKAQTDELRTRLELYLSGKPYREPLK